MARKKVTKRKVGWPKGRPRKKKTDTVYDFGPYGKWSKSTLKEQHRLLVDGAHDKQYEKNKLLREKIVGRLVRKHGLFGSKWVRETPTFESVYERLKEIDRLDKEVKYFNKNVVPVLNEVLNE